MRWDVRKGLYLSISILNGLQKWLHVRSPTVDHGGYRTGFLERLFLIKVTEFCVYLAMCTYICCHTRKDDVHTHVCAFICCCCIDSFTSIFIFFILKFWLLCLLEYCVFLKVKIRFSLQPLIVSLLLYKHWALPCQGVSHFYLLLVDSSLQTFFASQWETIINAGFPKFAWHCKIKNLIAILYIHRCKVLTVRCTWMHFV